MTEECISFKEASSNSTIRVAYFKKIRPSSVSTPEVPFRSNQEWYATFTGEDGSRYAVTLEDEDTLALKFYLDGGESYLSLVNTVYFARQEAMG